MTKVVKSANKALKNNKRDIAVQAIKATALFLLGEEKMMELHKTKRELADALLDGAESSAKMSIEDIMRILADACA